MALPGHLAEHKWRHVKTVATGVIIDTRYGVRAGGDICTPVENLKEASGS